MAQKPSRISRAVLAPVALATLVAGCSTLPQALDQGEQKQLAAADRRASQAGVEPLAKPLTLAEAVARGLKYNLDHRSRLMEQAVAMGQLDLSNFDMLPKLVASAGYSERNNDSISRAKDSVTGKPSLANPYISSDREHTTTDLGLTWNILDFGVSYFNAKQNGDRVLIAAERRRKAMHNLIQDVRSAYWRAACAQKLEFEIKNTIAMAEAALGDSRKAEAEKLRNPMDALRYQRTVLENLRILESIQQELSAARIELAALINLPPGSAFRLAEPAADELSPRYQPLPIEQMEETAVENNADLREHFYNVRISVAETRKSMLRMFPGLTFSYTGKHDTNSYLINQSWRETGLQLSWNLFNILSAPAAMDLSEASEKLAEHKRMAVQMAVLAQVHLARQQYENAYRLFERSDAIWDVDQRIFEHSAHRESVQAQSKLERISSNTAAIVSLLRRYQSLAQVYTANGKLQATLGLEPRVEDLNAITLTNLVPLVDKAMREWNSVVLAAKTGDTADVAPAPAAAAPASLADAPTAAAANEAPAAERAPAASAAHESAPAGVRRYFLGSFKLPARGPALDWNIEPEQVAWVASAGEAEGVVNGRLLLGVPSQGRRTAVVEWSLSDAGGRPLGRASYAGEVSKPATDEDWRLLKQGALAALTKIRSAQ
ncbi:MAG: hypothetical protein BGO63_17405 [Candidatus Accumulibacter sp. 66-26]|nr:MAG: hypothetical protein BGO63_17405 [Candidatus Accumulibacter sp. 66-26]